MSDLTPNEAVVEEWGTAFDKCYADLCTAKEKITSLEDQVCAISEELNWYQEFECACCPEPPPCQRATALCQLAMRKA